MHCGAPANEAKTRRIPQYPHVYYYPEGCAAPGEVPCQGNTRRALSKLKRPPPQRKINVTSKSPVGDIPVVTLIRTDTTLDHSQKAEKVWQGMHVCNSTSHGRATVCIRTIN